MPKPRAQQVSLDATPYYHCVSRCVRRAFLCGIDISTGESYEHRRAWVEEQLLLQTDVFAIDVAAYAVMSNHYHVVLHINKAKSDAWSDEEVIERWHKLYKGNPLSQRFMMNPEELSDVEWLRLQEYATVWRERLCDISWFMRRLNEFISRQANYEDGCTGHFWEGRFKSQALLDEKALAACLAYVDLNPVRAAMAKTPEKSEFTSVKARIEKAKAVHTANHPKQQPKKLMPFAGNPRNDMPFGLPFKLTDYLELVDWTGRQIRDDKRGFIANHYPSILERLGIEDDQWLQLTKGFEVCFKDLVGEPSSLTNALGLFNRQRRSNIQNSQALLT